MHRSVRGIQVAVRAARPRWPRALLSTSSPTDMNPFPREEVTPQTLGPVIDVVDSQTQALSLLEEENHSYSERVHVVSQLQRQGYSAIQAQGLVDAMKASFNESIDVQMAVLTTKAEHVALKSEILERVFNSTLKFDIAQRNMRDFLEHDFVTLKQDIHMMEKLDFEAVRNEIAQVEAKFLQQKEASDELFDNLVKANARLEKRILNYVAAFGSTIAIILAVLSSIIDKH
ncbi:hypothetical protein LEN26_018286 [Aphanomyces euteiches]|nr:hypothetical protein LEN26_018286 [Aphanomyces euteiches]KAH9115000.1 hypothetical protein AeMF1_010919 [Aphanomyces euteiches]KAH9195883.1 hypothetical protein AeNC1_002151 [Aphanomyces euteiches]